MTDPIPTQAEVPLGETAPARTSRAATFAAGLGFAGPSLALAGVLMSQLGAPAMSGFRLFLLGSLSGLSALAIGGVGLLLTRRGVGGRRRAQTGVGLGALMVAILALGIGSGAGAPPINDITTNLADPPGYAAVPPSHPNAARDMGYPADFVVQVEAGYPDLAPIRVALEPERAYRLALAQAKDLGWKITRADSAAGVFEAEDATALFRFVDDVSIRVRARAGGASVIDMRSKSRDGRGDLGANAERIRRFAAAVTAAP